MRNSPKKPGSELVQAASIKCLVFVAPLGVPHSTETDDMRPVLLPAVPFLNSAIDFRDSHGDIVAVTGVNYTPGSATVTILGVQLLFDGAESAELGIPEQNSPTIGDPRDSVLPADGSPVVATVDGAPVAQALPPAE